MRIKTVTTYTMDIHIILIFIIACVSLGAASRYTTFPQECEQVTFGTVKNGSSPCLEMCKCWVTKGTRYVKCINRNLTYIPQPPAWKKIPVKLFFLCNNLSIVSQKTFQNWTSENLIYLSLLFNNISHLAPDTFNGLQNVRGLDLSFNPLIGMPNLKRCFESMFLHSVPLTKINISHMKITNLNLSDDPFNGFREKKKFQIILMDNGLTEYPYRAFESVKGLTYLDLDGNPISSFSPPDNYTQENLKQIDFDNNYFPVFPNLCKSNKSQSFFPNLTKLKIRWNFMRLLDPDNYNCLNTLKDLRLNGNAIKVLHSNQFAGLPALENITLSYMDYNLRQIEDAPFNNSNIKRIYFRKNNLWFNRWDRNLHLFEGCSSLELLNLCDNDMGRMTDRDFEILLKPVANSLYELILGGCKLPKIPIFISKNMTNLVKLVMYQNFISDLPEGIFDDMKNLTEIRFANNKLSVISPRTFSTSFRNRLTVVELQYNPFSCTCDLRWFINWMRSHQKVFEHGFLLPNLTLRDTYTCTSPEMLYNKPLLDVYMSVNQCLLGQQEKIITLTLSCIVIVLFVAVSVLYRYRWHMRYFIYMARYSQRQEADTGNYDYDAFVSFSKHDRPWVVNTLLPVLEEGDNLKICVHDRDFLGGKLVIDNIVDGIEKSRKVILIMSNAFAKSRWCQFEMNLVQHRVIEHDERLLVVVLLEEIDSSYMTRGLNAMLQTTTYLMWGEEEFAKTAFFNRLRMILKMPGSTRRQRRESV